MKNYEFKATNLIAKTFEERGVHFRVEQAPGTEIVVAGFTIDGGPSVTERFISDDNDNDVAVRVYRLIANVPEEKRYRAMEACNLLSRKVRHLKFYVDRDGDVNVEYDFPVNTPDEGVGEMAFEMFVRTAKTLEDEYAVFMKAIYTDEELNSESLMQKLERLLKMREERLAASAEISNNEECEECEAEHKSDDSVVSPAC